jgi:hypothetical protein
VEPPAETGSALETSVPVPSSRRGQRLMEFSHNAQCPRDVGEKVIADAIARDEARRKK